MTAGFEIYNANGELINSDSYLRLNYVKSIGDKNIKYTKQNDEVIFYEGVVGGRNQNFTRHIFSTSSGTLGNTGIVSFDENGALLNKITETTPLKMYFFKANFVPGQHFVFDPNNSPDNLPVSRYAFCTSSALQPYFIVGGNQHILAFHPILETISTGVRASIEGGVVGMYNPDSNSGMIGSFTRNFYLSVIDISKI